MLWLAGTAARRAMKAERIRELCGVADFDRLSALLQRQSLTPLLGSRLGEIAGGLVPAWFSEHVAEIRAGFRTRALANELVTLELGCRLERAGIPAIPLKGPFLARELYGDSSLRFSADIDLLVRPADFTRACDVLAGMGYEGDVRAWYGGLPQFEASFVPADGNLPLVGIDLHWRIEWYRRDYGTELVDASVPCAGGARALRSEDLLPALLLFFARDAFWGLKGAIDLAAWWDAYGATAPPLLLDRVLDAHPELRRPLVTAALTAERLVGLPADRLMSAHWQRSGSRGAPALAHWTASGERRQLHAAVPLVDWLLVSRGGRRSYVRRHLVLPLAVVAQIYGVPPDARLRLRLHQWRYAVLFALGRMPRQIAHVVRARHEWLPPAVTAADR